MQPALEFIGDVAPALGDEVSLGPAKVVELRGATPIVALPDGREVRAELALAFPYAPQPGDTLLVIGKAQHYVIGVLQAGGEVSLRFRGDVSVHAVGGKLDLKGDEGVALDAPEVSMRTGKLEVVADKVVHKFTNLYQRVRERLNSHSGEKLELVDGQWHTRAESASVVTRGVVAINGKEVHLA